MLFPPTAFVSCSFFSVIIKVKDKMSNKSWADYIQRHTVYIYIHVTAGTIYLQRQVKPDTNGAIGPLWRVMMNVDLICGLWCCSEDHIKRNKAMTREREPFRNQD